MAHVGEAVPESHVSLASDSVDQAVSFLAGLTKPLATENDAAYDCQKQYQMLDDVHGWLTIPLVRGSQI